jgi:hypothetical protein
VKESSFKRLGALRFYVCDNTEKQNYGDRKQDEWLSRIRVERK